MRKCKKCGVEKPLEEFVRQQIWRRHTCKKCWNAKYATGKPNTGRFKKGQIPWIKGRKNVKKRTEPRYKKRERKTGSHRQCILQCQWSKEVLKRDKYKCIVCGSRENLISHHIIRWEDDKTKRFDVNNGQTLCRSCHTRHHRKEELSIGIDHFKGQIRDLNGYKK